MNGALGLPERCRIGPVRREYDHDVYQVRVGRGPLACPDCGAVAHVHSHATRCVFHLPLRGCPTVLELDCARMRRAACGRTFRGRDGIVSEEYPHLTRELHLQVIRELMSGEPVASISRRYGPSPTIVNGLLDELCCEWRYLPRTLCPGEFGADTDRGKYAARRVDGDGGSLIDVLPVHDAGGVGDRVMGFDERQRAGVEFAACDMSEIYASPIRVCLPCATLCVDRFHVARLVCGALTDYRRDLQRSERTTKEQAARPRRSWKLLPRRKGKLDDEGMERLERVLSIDDGLRACHGMPRNSCLWSGLDRGREVEGFFAEWSRIAKGSGIPQLVRCAKTFGSCRKEIMAGQRYRKTNAPAEGINNQIKVIKRKAFGFHDFEHMRKRCLIALGSRVIVPDHVRLPRPGAGSR